MSGDSIVVYTVCTVHAICVAYAVYTIYTINAINANGAVYAINAIGAVYAIYGRSRWGFFKNDRGITATKSCIPMSAVPNLRTTQGWFVLYQNLSQGLALARPLAKESRLLLL